ncbi:MAG: BatA domain-containing protein, partial [Acetobacteraceae bacterium]|nr:BatA domain-containing protein [Acetobacteraceae bacterium]
MSLTNPWVLLALAALPLLWWLLRVTPPAPKRESFPAIRLLAELKPTEETPARTPPWLLALRLFAAGLVIVGLAGPVRDAGSSLPGQGPVLLVLDNGWAAAPDWPRRMQAADGVLERAARAGRPAALLATAPHETGGAPAITPVMPAADLHARLASLRPAPWPADRAGATKALRGFALAGAGVVYIADGLTGGAGFADFAQALRGAGAVREICCGPAPPRLLLAPDSRPDRLVARVAQPPQAAETKAAVLAQTGEGRTLVRTEVTVPAGSAVGQADILAPAEVRNRLSRLVLEGAPSAGSVALLDEGLRRRPVGLVVSGDQAQADAAFIGSLFYVRRALAPYAELREADLPTLLSRDVSVLVMADNPPTEGPAREALTRWVEGGGLLVRFAGPRTAEAANADPAPSPAAPDPLLPESLIAGDRDLGGAMSWSKPAGLAAFPADSPFAGLPVPADVTVTREVLADPSAALAAHTWARLADGTPLVTEAARGRGRVVLFHVTADADWSNLPLSGVFVDMLRRLVALSAGVTATPASGAVLAPTQTLDGYGVLGRPPPAAAGLAADAFARTPVSPQHPPGFYGPETARRALNLANALPVPEAAPPVASAGREPFAGAAPARAFGPWLIAVAAGLLGLDMLIALVLRGLLRLPRARRVAAAALIGAVLAGGSAARADDLDTSPNPALATRLGYVVTGDTQVDTVSREGLEGLSVFVNQRTAVVLAEPDAIELGRTDLSLYPLLYWPITPDA